MSASTDVHFLENEDVEGFRLLHSIQDKNVIHDVKVKLGVSNHSPGLFFPGNRTVPFDMRYKINLQMEAHVIVPKPLGKRYLLFAHPDGKMYFENEKGEIFVLDQDRTPQLISINTVLDGIVVRKIVRDGTATEGKLTFVIMDATCVNGVDLTKKSFEERSLVIKVQVIQPALKATNRSDPNVIDFDMTKYEDVSNCEHYLNEQFQDHYEYPLASLVFQPLAGTYHAVGGKGKRTFEWDIHSNKDYLFRLKTSEGGSTGDLYAIGTKPKGVEIKFDTMDLTDEMRTIADGSIIECSGEHGSWNFIRVRDDFDHPNVQVVKDAREVKFPVTRQALLNIFNTGTTARTADETRTIVDGSTTMKRNYLCPKCWSAISGETDRTVVASCGHSFHEKCLKNMSDKNGVVAYPVCLFLSNFPTVICNREITSFLQFGNSRAYEFAVGTTFKNESRSDKKRKRHEPRDEEEENITAQ